MIAFDNFTPVTGLIGGALIGLSAALFLALNGRIAGISGAFSTVLLPSADARPKRLFILGLILAAPLWLLTMGTPTIVVEQPMWIVVLAGLIVGYFTRLGSGCTSGHGVCGLSRLSMRSLVATLCFMAAGMFMVALTRHAMTLIA